MNKMRIVGICLVRNEEKYFGQALANVYDFCDEIIIADNGSQDSTWEIAKEWAKKRKKITCRQIEDPGESHRMIEPFAGTPTWIFAVDGDELYDPAGLESFRKELETGKYDKYWRVIGNALNCVRLDLAGDQAEGYLSPPSRSITKLFNFAAITGWPGANGERLHGGKPAFKPGYGEKSRYVLNAEKTWDESSFRCLHLCFLPRSRLDKIGEDGRVSRWNLAEQQGNGLLVRVYASLLKRLGIYRTSGWKQDRYARGSLVSRPVRQFFQRAPHP